MTSEEDPELFFFKNMKEHQEITVEKINQLIELTTDVQMFSNAIQILSEVQNTIKNLEIRFSEIQFDPFWNLVLYNIQKHLISVTCQDKSPVVSVLDPVVKKFNTRNMSYKAGKNPLKYFSALHFINGNFDIEKSTFLSALKILLPLCSIAELKEIYLTLFDLMEKHKTTDFNRALFNIILDASKRDMTTLIIFMLSDYNVEFSFISELLSDGKEMQKLVDDLLFNCVFEIEFINISRKILLFIFYYIQKTKNYLDIDTKIESIDREKTLFEVLRFHLERISKQESKDDVTVEQKTEEKMVVESFLKKTEKKMIVETPQKTEEKMAVEAPQTVCSEEENPTFHTEKLLLRFFKNRKN